MKSDSSVEVVVHVPTILGEGPLWSQQEGVLYWLDIFKPTINCFNPGDGSNRVFDVEEPIYALGLNATGGFIAALDSGFALLSKDGALVKRLSNPIAGRNVNFNDGKVDDKGRFWSGTMARDWKSPIGALYKVGNDGRSQEMDSGIILSNGIAWSPDRTTMYFTDFGRKCVYAYNFNMGSGTIDVRRPLILFNEEEGSPDGITVDADGGIWVAHWDGWCVTRHEPNGGEISKVHVPVPRPTSVMFGGTNLDTLYITSATMHLSNTQLSEAPLSGALFALTPRVRGLPEPQFQYLAD